MLRGSHYAHGSPRGTRNHGQQTRYYERQRLQIECAHMKNHKMVSGVKAREGKGVEWSGVEGAKLTG
jgi:hypothetical protein